MSESLANIVTAAVNNTTDPATTIWGALSAGRLLGLLAAFANPADADAYADMATQFCARKADTGWPAAAFMSAFQQQRTIATHPDYAI